MTAPTAHWLDKAAAEAPTAPALVRPDSTATSFGELAVSSRELAARLLGAGAQPGRPIALSGLRKQEAVPLLYGAMHAGIPVLPLDSRLPADHRADLLRQSGARLVVVGEDGEVPPPAKVLSFGELLSAPKRPLPAESGAGTVQLIVATSGSSGRPKGVMLTAANLAAAVEASRCRIPVDAGSRWLHCLPLTHIGGVSILFRCMHAGAAVELHERFDPDAVAGALGEGRISHLSLVPAMLVPLLERFGNTAPPGLVAVLVGGAALAPSLRRQALAAGWPLCISYGMSETASQLATVCSPSGEDGSVGTPLPGFEVGLSKGEPGVPPGSGRLRVRGPAVMAGYVNPALRAGDGLDEAGWFVSRDLVRLEGGRVTVLGRVDDVLVSGGEKVHPAELERMLSGCPGIGEVAVTARTDPSWGDRLVLFYTGPVGPEDIERWCRQRLQGAWRPREFRRIDELPLTGPSKPDRRRLRELAEE